MPHKNITIMVKTGNLLHGKNNKNGAVFHIEHTAVDVQGMTITFFPLALKGK